MAFEALFVVVAPPPSEYRPRGGVFCLAHNEFTSNGRMECRWWGVSVPPKLLF